MQGFSGEAVLASQGAIPFAFKSVRDKEQQVAEARDNQYAKDAARDSRLKVGKSG